MISTSHDSGALLRRALRLPGEPSSAAAARAAGADALSFDHGVVQDLDAVGTAVDAGTHLFLGVVSGTDRPMPTPKATATRVQAWWNELGFPAERLHTAVTLTPSCGLAGASPAYARAAMTHVREAARYLLPE